MNKMGTGQQKETWMNRLETRWGVKGWGQISVIFFVFAVTGSLSVRISKPILDFLGIHKEQMSAFLFWPLRILIVFPAYQVLLITIGTLCGQFKFFWKMEKKMISRIISPFRRISGVHTRS
jgi:hypothetical protein